MTKWDQARWLDVRAIEVGFVGVSTFYGAAIMADSATKIFEADLGYA